MVKVYHDKLEIVGAETMIYDGCPYIIAPKDEAEALAEVLIQEGVWSSYCIPELLSPEFTVIRGSGEGRRDEKMRALRYKVTGASGSRGLTMIIYAASGREAIEEFKRLCNVEYNSYFAEE